MIKSAYLAGPMRNYKEFNFPRFEFAMQDLQYRGIRILSPHKMDLDAGFDPSQGQYDDTFRNECVRRDIDAIIKTDGVIFLEGWENSVGARAEFAVARWLEHPCYTYPDLELIPE